MEAISKYLVMPRSEKVGWRGVALCVLAVILLVCAVNTAAWYYIKAYPVNRGVSRVWQKWQLIERQTEPVDWLILGDSTCGQGIMPVVIEEDTSDTALNLCTVANATAVNGVWQLEHYIDKVGPPTRAVFFHAYHVWERPPDDLISMFNQISIPGAFYKRMDPPLDVGFWGDIEIATAPLRTLYDANLSIDYIISRELGALFAGKDVDRSDALSDLNFVIRHKGYVGSNTAMPERVIAQSNASKRIYAEREFVITPPNEESLKAMCRLSERHNLPIYLANSSISRMLYEDEGFQKYYSAMVERISEILAPCPGVTYVMQVPAQFEPEEMDNEDHVVTDTVAARLTRQLVDAVKSSGAEDFAAQ